VDLPEVAVQGDGVLTIRPEAVQFGPGENARNARITAITFLGTQTRVDLELEGLALQALISPNTANGLSVGAEVGITLPPEAIWLLPLD